MTFNSDAKLRIYIKGKNKKYFDGYASSVSSENDKGIFDVLPYHANFITLLKNQIIVNKGLADEQTFKIDKGLLSVFANEVKVYVGL